MLIKKVTFYDFLEEFKKHGREDQFSYDGKRALFEYLNELSEDIGEPIELDVVAICCEFTEYKNLKEFNRDYSYSLGYNIEDIKDIQEHTILIPIDAKSFIIQDF